jgi:parallel beta-helix repeat protein
VIPSTAPISSIDNVTYILTDKIRDSIVIEKDNITLDGKGHILQGAEVGNGINLTLRNNVTIQNMQIENFSYGIYLYTSSNIILFNNTIKNNTWDGVYAVFTDSSIIYGNNISVNKRYGVVLSESGSNKILHNNFIQNAQNNTYLYNAFNNVWDNSYPSGGNYWSNYTGIDSNSGLLQNETGRDGIGDTPNTLDYPTYNQDNYPLMAPINLFDIGIWNNEPYNVEIVTDSYVSNFRLNETQKILSFNVAPKTSSGFCRITMPNIIIQNMWQGNYTVLVDGEQPSVIRNWTDLVCTYVYIVYFQEHEVIIVPEFHLTIILPLFFVSIIATFTMRRKRRIPK